jgi:hypothetical protein
MQQLLTIKLTGNYGVNYDLEPCDLDLNTLTSGKNFLLRNGKVKSFYGSTFITADVATHQLAQFMFVASSPNKYYLCMGNKAVYVFDGAAWTPIGYGAYSLMGSGDEYYWTYCNMGLIPVINNPQGYPQYWSPQVVSTVLKDLPYDNTHTWTTKGFRCDVIRSHKNFLFALGMYEGGNYYPNNYRWSTAADNNGIPYTWEPTDLSGIAGQASILGDNGPIVDGLSLKNAFCIYTTDGITILEPSGDSYIWQARSLSNTVGLLAPNCVASMNGVHIFLSRGDIMLNDGNSIRSVINGKIRTRLKGLANGNYYKRSYCVCDERNKEVWFCIPIDTSTYPNFAIIYNIVDDSLSMRYIDRPITAMTYGPSSIGATSWSGVIDPYTVWDTSPYTWAKMPGFWATGIESTVTWNTKKGNWNTDDSSPFSYQILGIEPDAGGIYDMSNNDGTSDDNLLLERIGAVFTDQRSVESIIRAYPHMQGNSPVNIQLGSQEAVGQDISWSNPVSFNPSKDRKVDIRTTGKLHGWRLESTDNVDLTFFGMDVEYVNNGVR